MFPFDFSRIIFIVEISYCIGFQCPVSVGGRLIAGMFAFETSAGRCGDRTGSGSFRPNMWCLFDRTIGIVRNLIATRNYQFVVSATSRAADRGIKFTFAGNVGFYTMWCWFM